MEQRLIDANALMKAIKMHHYPIATRNNSVDKGMFTVGIQQLVDDAPTIDPVRRGEWVEKRYIYYGPDNEITEEERLIVCGECGKQRPAGFGTFNYCPSCGADMRGAE